MKKLLAGLAIATTSMFGLGGVASAYPPDDAIVVLSDSTVAPGEAFNASLNGCLLGEVVTGTVAGDSDTATCTGPAGTSRVLAAPGGASATVTLIAPTTPGTYPVTVTGNTSGVTATATITVVAAGGDDDGDALPATGSSSTPIAQVGAGVLVAGLGLTAVAMYRRRSRAAA